MTFTIKKGTLTFNGEICDRDIFEAVQTAESKEKAVKTVMIPQADRVTDAGLMMLTCFKDSLQSIEVKGLQELTSRISPQDCGGRRRCLPSALYMILKECHKLKEFRLIQPNALIMNQEVLDVISKKGKNLRTLALIPNTKGLCPTGSLKISGVNQLKNLTSLMILNLPQVSFKSIIDAAAGLPKLEHLGIQGGKVSNDSDIKYLTSKIHRLFGLYLISPSSFTETGLAHLADAPLKESLGALIIHNLNTRSPADWKMCAAFVNLQAFILYNCNINGDNLSYLLGRITSLQNIELENCPSLDQQKLVTLKETYPNTEFQIEDPQEQKQNGFFSSWF